MGIPKAVVCLTYFKWYESIQYASKVTNTTREQIIDCCKGRIPYTINEYNTKLEWVYKEDFVALHGEDAFWELHRTTQDFYTNDIRED